mgnify:CR=1 FL=1
MKQIADLHIHSRYSMATSKDGTPEMLDFWARKKGITLLGTGDMTHPVWRQELKDKLVPAEQGLFRLKDEFVLPEAARYPGTAQDLCCRVRSVLSIKKAEKPGRCTA